MKKRIGIIVLGIAIIIGAIVLLVLNSTDDEASVKTDSTIELIENDVYDAPSNPSIYQTTVYNELSEALEDEEDGEVIATLVATNFCADFYTLKNKESADDVGGLTYIPLAYRDDFESYASAYVYTQYNYIVDDYGTSSLFEVDNISVTSINEQQYYYTDLIEASESSTGEEYYEEILVDGYEVYIEFEYETSEVDESEMKMSALVKVICLHDVYYVLAVE